MHSNGVKVFSCFLFFFVAHLVDGSCIYQEQNSVPNDSFSEINTVTDDKINDAKFLLMFTINPALNMKKRAQSADEAVENLLDKCNNNNGLEEGGNDGMDISFEMAESHIFRPLFRNRVRKSSNTRA